MLQIIFLNFLLKNNMFYSFHKIIKQHNIFIINHNKKCFLSSISALCNDFCRIMWHWSNDI